MPTWLAEFLIKFGTSLVAAGWGAIKFEQELLNKAAEQERLSGIRNGENAKKYQDAQTRADQIRAAIDLINRNN
ncbi:hypothetical protein BdPhPhi1402_gp36 [Bdellovibrio phage phi1402]|uniref:hypothetical protein n=1 Tax=Bdellovibrio phage phi1402 TaxID=1035662 RepID=UPI000211A2E2|nr:hypothetical protein BdPhPhi1402_gp36 [Bdellovibrio phage phi1402]AEG42333.1 hypothetical protein [Bdellovibrio phage phi1402]